MPSTTADGAISRSIGARAAIAVAAAGAAISIGQAIATRQIENGQLHRHFETLAASGAQAIARSFSATVKSVEGVAALFRAAPATERQVFGHYAEPLLASDKTVLNLSWAPRVPADKREEYERAVHVDGVTDFHFIERDSTGKAVPAGQRAEYVPLYMLEPLAPNRAALGFDMLSNDIRRKAAERARDSAKVALSAPIDLVQGGRGIVAYVPVYEAGARLDDEAQRRAALKGFGIGTFRASEMINAIIGEYVRQGVDVWIFDTAAEKSQLVHAVMAEASTPSPRKT